MIRALIYLRLATLKNRILVSVRRLRQPKYVAGALAGAAYVYYFVFGRLRPSYPGLPHSAVVSDPGLTAIYFQYLLHIGAAAVFVFLLWRQAILWKSPPEQAGLRFSEAEIAFLFPAPLSRGRLVHFSLIKSQLLILLSSLFLSLFFSTRGGFATLSLVHLTGWWIILSVVNFHSTAASLTIVRLRQVLPDFALLRRIALVTITLLAASTILTFYRAATLSSGQANLFAFLDSCLRFGFLPYLLYPFTWVVGPFLAADLPSFARAIPPGLTLIALLYLWILRLQVPFEEGSIALAEKRSQRRSLPDSPASAAVRPLREPFPLASHGRPETAFLWKNLFAIQSWFNLRLFAGAIALVTAILWSSGLSSGHGLGRGAHFVPLALIGSAMLAFYTLLVGPQLLRQDLRGDLANADMLKTYPLGGWQVVLGEMLTPLAILCGLLWLSLFIAIWALSQIASEIPWLTPDLLIALTLCSAAIIPPICILQLLIPNAAALLFPTWFQATRNRTGGVEIIGQRLIFSFGQLLAILVALCPAVISAALLIFASQWLVGLPAAVLLATLAVLAIVLTEVACGLWWLGRHFEQYDITEIEM